MQTLEKIISGCVKNDPKAQKLLYDRYSAVMLGVCLRYCRTLVDAEDVLQEGFFKLFVNIGSFRSEGPFEAWMKKIFVNTAISHYHQQKKSLEQEELKLEMEYKVSQKELYHSDFTHEELLGVIKGLPDGYRMVFNLYAIEGYKHSEIAEQLGIDENTSKSQYSRARMQIQKKLEMLSLEKKPLKNVNVNA